MLDQLYLSFIINWSIDNRPAIWSPLKINERLKQWTFRFVEVVRQSTQGNRKFLEYFLTNSALSILLCKWASLCRHFVCLMVFNCLVELPQKTPFKTLASVTKLRSINWVIIWQPLINQIVIMTSELVRDLVWILMRFICKSAAW